MVKAHTFQHIVDKQVEKYNERYAEFGDDCRALGWPREEDNARRFEAMSLWLINWHRHPGETVSLLDFGCGLGHFCEWLEKHYFDPDYRDIEYLGLDVNSSFVDACAKKFGGAGHYKFCKLDILDDEDFGKLPVFDYIACNGVFTEKLDTPRADQWDYLRAVVSRLWQRTNHGIAFNVMSPVADYERDDLFYVHFSKMAKFIKWELGTKSFVFRQDYGLWEYTTYAYKE